MNIPADSAPPLTAQQRRPLDVFGSSVALSAGAGCGKTTVLTSRFLAALDGRGALSSLVALTFTEKAARELRQRIRRDCHKRLGQAVGAEDVGFWRDVLRGLEAAPVGTFHEYSASLLRRHSLRAGIDPDFQVLDESIASSLLEDALARRLRRWLAEKNEDLIELAVEFGLRQVREGLQALVRGRRSEGLEDWPERTVEEVVARWREEWEAVGRPALFRTVEKAVRRCAEWLNIQEFRHDKLTRFQAELLPELFDVGPGLSVELLSALRERAKMPTGLRVTHWPSPEVNESCKDVLKSLRDALDKFLEKNEPDEQATRRAAESGLRFARLAAEARRAYEASKRARGGLDFDDLLVKARDLLRDSSDEGVEFVLVDEFQDTDPIQAEILKRLCGERFTSGGLFVVGDFKQSIYRFRGAEPKLFQNFRDDFPEAGRHALTENFRSSTSVVNFINALFGEAFADENPRLLAGPHAHPASADPAVEFVWAHEPRAESIEGEKQAEPDADERRRVEARWLARLIRSRLDDGWLVRDRSTKQVRRAHEGDVAFLFRALTDLASYEQALESEGLDYHVVGGKAFYAQQEVKDLVNVLSVVEDPLDSASLAGALRGPFFGLTDEALFWLHAAGRGDLARGLATFGEDSSLSSIDRPRAVRARGLLARWRELKDWRPIAELVDRVLDESGFEAALSGESLGGRKRANARKIVRLARRFDARGGFTLADFVARLRADLRDPPREEQAATTEEEGKSVRLMSIHQSKGLEFPIVVVPDLNRKSDMVRGAVAFTPRLGPLVRPVKEDSAASADATDREPGSGRSLGWVTYEAIEKQEDEEESLRLFYVATTRARDNLILSAGVSPVEKPVSPALRLLDERFDRGAGACLVPLPEDWGVPAVHVTSEPPPATTATRAHRPRLAPKEAARVILSAPRREPRVNPDGFDRLVPRFVDLDPAHARSTRSRRLDRLVRAVLADPRLPGGRDPMTALAEATRRAGRRQDPVARGDLVEEVVTLLSPWLAGPLGAEIAGATVLERGPTWAVSWSISEDEPIVFQGATDFFTRDAKEVGRALTFSLPGASEPLERLRLLLSARAAVALGLGPIREAWRIQLGDAVHGETSFDDQTIDLAVRDALSSLFRSTRPRDL